MSEIEIKEDVQLEAPISNEAETTLSDFEKEQVKTGWNPKGTKSAEEWARNAEIYEEKHKLQRALKNAQKTNDYLMKMMRKQEQAAYDKAMSEFEAQKEAAIKRGDMKLVQQAEQQQQQLVAPEPLEVIEFKNKYEDIFASDSKQDKVIKTWILGKDIELAKQRLNPRDHFTLLEQEMLEEFSDYFGKDSSAKVENVIPQVESSENTRTLNSGHKKHYRYSDLDHTQKTVCDEMVKRGVFKDRDEFIRELAKLGELK